MNRLAVAVVVAVACAMPLLAQRASKPPARPPAKPPTPPAAVRVERGVPFAVGETLTYDVSWSGYLTAGTAVTTVKERKPSYNSTAYYVVAEGRPTPLLQKFYTLYYKVDALIDVFTLLSQRGSFYSEEGRRRQLQTTVFDRASNTARVELQTTTLSSEVIPVSPGVQDGLSAIYALRAMPLNAGERITMPVSDRGNNYQVQFTAGAHEPVHVPFGDVTAWKIATAVADDKGQPVGRNLAIWLSDDAKRLPVKLQAELPVGSFRLDLRDVR